MVNLEDDIPPKKLFSTFLNHAYSNLSSRQMARLGFLPNPKLQRDSNPRRVGPFGHSTD